MNWGIIGSIHERKCSIDKIEIHCKKMYEILKDYIEGLFLQRFASMIPHPTYLPSKVSLYRV